MATAADFLFSPTAVISAPLSSSPRRRGSSLTGKVVAPVTVLFFSCLDSRLRGNDGKEGTSLRPLSSSPRPFLSRPRPSRHPRAPLVIPAQAGIQSHAEIRGHIRKAVYAGFLGPGDSSNDRVDGLDKRKAVEIGVASIDPADPMLAHEDSGLGVEEKVAAQKN